MKKIIFTEEFCQPENLFPFTLTRQIQDIRVGILTIREKWEMMLGLESSDRKEDDYKDLDRAVDLSDASPRDHFFLVHGNVLPTPTIIRAAKKLEPGEFLTAEGQTGFVYRFSGREIKGNHSIGVKKAVTLDEAIRVIRYPWDIVALNDWAIREDFRLLTRKRKSASIPSSNRVSNRSGIFIEKGAVVEHCILNADKGPIYIGRNAELLEGSMIRGPFSIGEGALLKMGSTVYGATTIGPWCIGAGEIKNSVLMGFSNKAHHGYLGDSVIGEWCNLGAGTTNSNLKNNVGTINMWTPGGPVSAGIKCGVMMGDYTRTSINTSINTGTVIGVSANVFGAGLTPKYIPSFSWGSEGIRRYEADKAIRDASAWKKLKGQEMTENDIKILQHIYQNF
ncbi:MAG: glucose-1-phosphate thymidylyltransferase [Chitinophagaceae bacterium]|nr:MAG: glucose-1-phosphate thymidylyltransferase [Chitinophagaceae bacterium]